MAGPSWLAVTLAGIMIITAAYCASRLVISRRRHRPADHQVDGVHVLMGMAMAGMLVPQLRVFWAGGWEIVFAAGAVLFGWQTIRGLGDAVRQAHHLPHALACVAMLYMFLAPASAGQAGTGMHGMAGGAAHWRTLALLLAVALLGYVIVTADRIPAMKRVATSATRVMPVIAGPAGGGTGRAAEGIAGDPGQASPAGASQAGPPGASRADPGRHGLAAPMSPRLAACCEMAMGVTMGYMLITML